MFSKSSYRKYTPKNRDVLNTILTSKKDRTDVKFLVLCDKNFFQPFPLFLLILTAFQVILKETLSIFN